ncbi:MAG: hypothetical protein BWY57_00994 [Betaproteobacteria bacterium ADurb.Bin341]|nr:MAG: hypothetical protein BWY57_00994 [Betaproteobacteria bacterium ADurb.Bin341]
MRNTNFWFPLDEENATTAARKNILKLATDVEDGQVLQTEVDIGDGRVREVDIRRTDGQIEARFGPFIE